MSGPKPLPHRETFEARGETQVRFEYWDRTDESGKAARSWLAEKQIERETEASSRRDAREERTLAIAEDANRIASSALLSSKRANTIAIAAIISAAIAAVIATIIAKCVI